jgi:hypothetical protein
MLVVVDDKLVDTMRAFVMAANRLDYLSQRDHIDLGQMEAAGQEHRRASEALQEALVSRGWRRPGE